MPKNQNLIRLLLTVVISSGLAVGVTSLVVQSQNTGILGPGYLFVDGGSHLARTGAATGLILGGNLGVGSVNSFQNASPTARLHVAGSIRIDTATNTLTSPPLRSYLPISVNGVAYYLPLYTGTTLLVNGQHTSNECVAAGGEVVNDGSGNWFCRFSTFGLYCPTGWTTYNSGSAVWSTTVSRTCDGDHFQCFAPNTSCTTGGHSWSLQALETCNYNEETSEPAFPAEIECPTIEASICFAAATEIGCF